MSFTSASGRSAQDLSEVDRSRWSDVRLAVAAKAVSACGDFVAATALLLTLQARGAGGYAVAALLLAAAVPPVLLARWTGRLADRVDSRLLLVATGLAQAVSCAAMAFAGGTAVLIGLAALLSCGYAVTQPTLAALLPAMVRRADVVRAGALGQTATAVGTLVAPAVAGVLTGAFGLRVPLLVDAASYLAIVAAGVLIRTRRGGAAPAGPAAVGVAAPPAPAWRLRADPLLFTMFVTSAAVVAAVCAINVADVFLVRGVLHSSATMYGLLSAVWTGSTILGGVALGRRNGGDASLGVAMLGAFAVTSAAIVAEAAAPSLIWLVPMFVIGGAGNGVLNVASGALVARRTPASMRGRAFATFGAVVNGSSAVGFVLGGVLLGLLPVRLTVGVAGLFGLVVTAAFAVPMLKAAARVRASAPVVEPVEPGPDHGVSPTGVSPTTAGAGVACGG